MQKRILSLLVVLCLLFTLTPATLAAEETTPSWTGAGTSGSPYLIKDRADLEALAASVNGGDPHEGEYFRLEADIDLSGVEWTPIGTKDNPFKGTFQGKTGESTVSNLTINDPTLSYAGLFGVLHTPGVLKNLTIQNPSVTAKAYVGALVGAAYTGTVSGVTVKGDIQINGNYMVGGLTGWGYASMDKCVVAGEPGSKVVGTYSADDFEGDSVGGLAGFRGEGNVHTTNCSVSNLSVAGTRKVGGLIGSLFCDNTLTDCSVQNVTATTNATVDYANQKNTSMGVGGLVGILNLYGSNGGTLSNCWVENITLGAQETGVENVAKMGYVSGGLYAALSDGNFPVPTAVQLTVENVAALGTNSGSNIPAGQADSVVLGGTAPDGTHVARVGGKLFTSLQAAVTDVEAQKKAATVTLLRDTTEDVTMGQGTTRADVYLELAGHTVEGNFKVGAGSAEKFNQGRLYLNFSGDQTGTVKGDLTAAGYNVYVYIYGGHITGTVTSGEATESGSKKGNVFAYGGYFTGGWAKQGSGVLHLYGGHYLNDPSAFLENGYIAKPLAQAVEYGCVYQVVEDQVAKIERDGETVIYKTFNAAVSGAKDGETIVLLKNVNNKNGHPTIGKAITLDLGGFELSGELDYVLEISKYSPRIGVTVKNGKITFAPPADAARQAGQAIRVRQMVDLTLENVEVSATTPDSVAVQMDYSQNGSGRDPKVIVKGADTRITGGSTGIAVFNNNNGNPAGPTSGTVVVEDGTVTGGWYGIAGNGECHNTSITVNGGTVRSTEPTGTGIFHPQKGVLTVNGGVIEGASGIEMRAGTLNVNGGTITGTADSFSKGANSSGNTTHGVGIAVSQHGTKLPITVNIHKTGGDPPVISGLYGLYEDTLEADPKPEDISIHIRDGEFTSTDTATKTAVYSANNKITISGGHFNTDPSAYMAADHVLAHGDKEGYYKVATMEDPADDVAPAVGADVVKAADTVEEKDKETVKALASTVTLPDATLADAATAAAAAVTWEQKLAAEAAIKESADVTVGEGDPVRVFGQVYLSITPTAYVDNTVTMDITPMSRVVASTVADPAQIKVAGEVEAGETPNAVVLAESAAPLDAITNTAVTVELPAGFVPETDVTYYVRHTHAGSVYHYPLTITETGGKRTATFTNVHGFSAFQLPVTLENVVATVTKDGVEMPYETLEEAIAAVNADTSGDDLTVTVRQSGAYAPFKLNRSKVTVKAAEGVTAAIDVAGNTDMGVNGTDVTLENLRFTTQNGASILSYIPADQLTLRSCSFINNAEKPGGMALYIHYPNITMENCTFENWERGYYTCGDNHAAGVMSFIGNTFTNVRVPIDGYWGKSKTEATDIRITGNKFDAGSWGTAYIQLWDYAQFLKWAGNTDTDRQGSALNATVSGNTYVGDVKIYKTHCDWYDTSNVTIEDTDAVINRHLVELEGVDSATVTNADGTPITGFDTHSGSVVRGGKTYIYLLAEGNYQFHVKPTLPEGQTSDVAETIEVTVVPPRNEEGEVATNHVAATPPNEEKLYVAQVGETKYTSLAEAIDAAKNGGTVTLLTDVKVDVWNQVWDANGLTINGNGKTLTVGKVTSLENGDFLFYGAENLTVSNLNVVFSTNGNGFSMASGKLENVRMTGGRGSNYAVFVDLSADRTDKVEVTGCTLQNFKGAAIYSQPNLAPAENPGLITSDIVVTGSTIQECGIAITSYAADTAFTGNTVTGSSEVSFAAKAEGLNTGEVTYTVTGNKFDDAGKIWFYGADLDVVTFEKNQVLGDTYLSAEEAEKGALDVSGNYWDGGAPEDKLVNDNENAAIRYDNYYKVPDMTSNEYLNTYHTVTVTQTQGGTVTIDKEGALEGDPITVTAIPDEGYVTVDVTYTVDRDVVCHVDMNGNEGAFGMPSGDVEVAARFDPYRISLDAEPVAIKVGESKTIGTVAVPSGWTLTMDAGNENVSLRLEGDRIIATGETAGPVRVTVAIKKGDVTLISAAKELTVEAAAVPYYNISATYTEGGRILLDLISAPEGGTVTVTVDPDEGCRLRELTATDANGVPVELTKVNDATYTLTMGNSDVAVHAVFAADVSTPDVYTLSVDTDPTIEVGGSKKIGSATVSQGLTLVFRPETNEFVTLEWKDGDIIATGVKPGEVEVTFSIQKGSEALESVTRTVTVAPKAAPGGSKPSVTNYPVTVTKAEGGKVSAGIKRAAQGSTVTVTVTPDEGFLLDTLTVTDAKGNALKLTDKGEGVFTFQMPGSEVKITAKFTLAGYTCDGGETCPAYHLNDINANAWYHEAVDYVVSRGLMKGVAEDVFAPDTDTSRAMVVTVLYRLEGEPKVSKAAPFDDVAAGRYYTNAVAWATANGIVKGYGNGSFGPDDAVTREQMAAILHRYAAYKGYDMTAQADLSDYTDAAQISAYAADAMVWANAQGLIIGTDAKALLPQDSATRAQVAAILMRFCEAVAK